MPIDARIPLQARTPEISLSPLMDALQFKQNRRGQEINQDIAVQNQDMARQKFAQSKMEWAKKKHVKDLFDSSVEIGPNGQKKPNIDKFVQLLLDNGHNAEAMKVGRQNEKNKAEESKQRIDKVNSENTARRNVLRSIQYKSEALDDDRERAIHIKNGYKALGLPTENIGDTVSPAKYQQMLSSYDYLDAPQQQFADTKLQKFPGKDGFMRTFDPSSGTAGFALDAEGKKVPVQESFTIKETPQGFVQVPTKQRVTEKPSVIPGMTPATKKKRELEEKRVDLAIKQADVNLKKATTLAKQGGQFKGTQYDAAGFGIRMKEVEDGFETLFNTPGFDPTSLTFSMMKRGPEVLKSGPLKSYLQYQRNFINATLREESGAAIAQSEFDNAQAQYFPQVGDSPEILQQKKRNREIKQATYKAEAGGAWLETGSALANIRNNTLIPITNKPIGAKTFSKDDEALFKKYGITD